MWLKLNARHSDTKKELKKAEAALDAAAYSKYLDLSAPEIKSLAVDDKWLVAVSRAIRDEVRRMSNVLGTRVNELVERYETPLPEAMARVSALEQTLVEHVKRMGFKLGSTGAASESREVRSGSASNWEAKSLGSLFEFSGGYSAARDQLSEDGHYYLHYGDIHAAHTPFVDLRKGAGQIPRLDVPLSEINARALLDDGDVVFVDASEDDEGASKHVVVVNPDHQPFISGLHTIVAKPKTNELSHDYRRYCFQRFAIRKQFRFFAAGTKVTGISKTNIKKVTLPVPRLEEQSAIAKILTDLDDELDALAVKLAKMGMLKQGIMQSLLTGKIRLV